MKQERAQRPDDLHVFPSFARGFEPEYSDRVDEPIKTVPGYQWIVADSDLLGGQPAVKATRLSVSHILACLAEGMSGEDIARDYPGFPPESVPEVCQASVLGNRAFR